MSGVEVPKEDRKQDVSEICGQAVDPADYLFKNTNYQDWKVTVTDPVSKKVEELGVVSSHLAAHSSVFRTMLEHGKNNRKEIKINNISLEVFKLILRFVYGGKLPVIDRETAAQLALGAMMYEIQPILALASELLKPASVDDVFPALLVVVHTSHPTLLRQVKKVVQEETKELVEREEFLRLDGKCIDFIAAQEQLAISEVELWKALVKWAENKAKEDDSKTLRDLLKSTLQFVRFASMDQNDIIKEVMPKKIISPSEASELLIAISNNSTWECPGLCSVQKHRELSTCPVNEVCAPVDVSFKEDCHFKYIGITGPNGYQCSIQSQKDLKYSNFTITTSQYLEIQSFTFKSRSFANQVGKPIYNMACTITISKTVNGFCIDSRVINVGGMVAIDNDIAFPLKLRNGSCLVLEPNSTYNVAVEFTSEHPTCSVFSNGVDRSIMLFNTYKGMTIKSNSPFIHAREIRYRI